jgi:hypothetical protein
MTPEDRKNFDLKGLLGKFCMVNITHSEDGKYANISGISPVPSALRAAQPEGINPVMHFWLKDFDQAKYDALPKYYKERLLNLPSGVVKKPVMRKKPLIHHLTMICQIFHFDLRGSVFGEAVGTTWRLCLGICP